MLEALVRQASPVEALLRYPDLVGIIESRMRTDVPLSRLGEVAAAVAGADTSAVPAVSFVPPRYPAGEAPAELVRATVAAVLAGGQEHDAPAASLREACSPPED